MTMAYMERVGAHHRAIWGTVSFFVLALAICVWALLVALLMLLGPRYEEIFRDFGIALSNMTRMSLQMSRWLRGDQFGQRVPGVVLGLLVSVPVMTTIGFAAFYPRTRVFGLVVAVLLLVLGVVLGLGAIIATQIDLMKLHESLQGGHL